MYRYNMARRTKQLRLTQLEEFLHKVDSCRGKFSARKKKELGKHFLEVVMGLKGKFDYCKEEKESPDFEARNEELYPWALFVTDKEDLREEYDHRANSYLHPDKVGEEFHAIITNGKELCVFDFNHEVAKYTVLFTELISGNAKAIKHWQAFLVDFGVESAKENKKTYSRRKLWLVKPSREVKDNVVFHGDNLAVMRTLKPGKIDFIYIDPPFCSNSIRMDKAWGKKVVSFNDAWMGGINAYIKWLIPRLRECYRLLKDTGVFCLHLDHRSSHYAKVELDKIFGQNNMINEIIWQRDPAGKGAKKTSKQFPRNHDTILIYSKTQNFTFRQLQVPLTNEQEKNYRYIEPRTERKFKTVSLGDYSASSITKMDKEGLIYISGSGKKYKKYYLDEAKGTIGSVWTDILGFGTRTGAKERVGYPTQKPLALLNRLIEAFTSKGDLVFDAFCGCGTTISSAQKLKRRWLGIDVSKDAIDVIKKRMIRDHKLRVEVARDDSLSKSQVMSLPPFEFEKHMVLLIGGTPNIQQRKDGGVDGYTYDHIPIQVKKSYGVGRPIIDKFFKHIQNRGAGIIIAHSFSKDAHEEADRLENEHGYTVDLMYTKDLLRDSA